MTFKKGKSIFIEGEMVEGIFFIYEGWVKIHKQWTHPKEMIIRFAKSGDIIGHRGIGGDKTYPVSATALEDVSVCFVSADFLENSLRANPVLTYELMQFYAAELQLAEKRMRDLGHMEVKGRVAGALLDLEKLFGNNGDGHISLTVSRQVIASFAGTTYETVFKLFNEFTQKKLISTHGKNIRILDPEKLRQHLLFES
jgi:CRP/FNR family transcriptional regulator